MVGRILDAAATVLAADGYQRASTNRIAAEAGVSPGSLYRYFDDKDAIVTALSHRLAADFGAELAPVLRSALVRPREEVTPLIVGAVLDALERHASLLRAIVDRVPADEQAEALAAIRPRVFDATFHLLTLHARERDPERLEAAAWLIMQTTQQLTVRYVLDAPAFPREVLVEGIERIVEALLP